MPRQCLAVATLLNDLASRRASRSTGLSIRKYAVNQWNSPAGPNLGQPATKPKKKWPWIVLSVVLVVLLAVGVLSVMVAKKRAEIAAEQAPFEQGPIAATPPPPPPPMPGAPVSCRKDRPKSTLTCFPEDIDPDVAVNGVAGEVGWPCLRQDERDEDGNRVFEQRKCLGSNNADQPYRLKQSISYETWDLQPGSAVQSFTLDASTSAAEHKGEHTTRQDATNALADLFVRANPHLWQGKPQLQQEAAATFEQLKPRCASPKGHSIEGESATTPAGYEVECSSPAGGIAVADAITYQQQIKITAK